MQHLLADIREESYQLNFKYFSGLVDGSDKNGYLALVRAAMDTLLQLRSTYLF